MPELSDLLHRSVDDVDVPHPAAHDILGRGRSMRTRRRAGTVLAAVVVVGALGVGGVLINGLDGDPRSSDVAGQDKSGVSAAQQAYEDKGAWVAGGKVTIGDKVVDLDAVVHLAQTSAGVVAQVRDDEGASTYTLIRPNGRKVTLSIPADVINVEGDLNATRVAWLETQSESIEVHVWDVVADREVGSGRQPVQGENPDGGGQFLSVALLDGDFAYFDAGGGVTFRVNWRRGGATALDHLPFSVHHDIATVLEGQEWVIRNLAKNTVVRRLDGTYLNPSISPDGTQVLLIDTSGASPVGSIEPIEGGVRTDLAEVETVAVWTRANRVLSLIAGGVQVCGGDGNCEGQSVDSGDGFVLLADFLNVG